jgi:hypothetical protein
MKQTVGALVIALPSVAGPVLATEMPIGRPLSNPAFSWTSCHLGRACRRQLGAGKRHCEQRADDGVFVTDLPGPMIASCTSCTGWRVRLRRPRSAHRLDGGRRHPMGIRPQLVGQP